LRFSQQPLFPPRYSIIAAAAAAATAAAEAATAEAFSLD
jgi:hypothetical protein